MISHSPTPRITLLSIEKDDDGRPCEWDVLHSERVSKLRHPRGQPHITNQRAHRFPCCRNIIHATPPQARRSSDHLYQPSGTLIYLGPYGDGPEPTVPRNVPVEKRAPSDYAFILPHEATQLPNPDASIGITLWQGVGGGRPGPVVGGIPMRGEVVGEGGATEVYGRIGEAGPTVCHIPGHGYTIVTTVSIWCYRFVGYISV